MAIECLVLGAGQEVGKSCVVVTINGKRIMFDCGMHMGYDDHRRYPDFSLISKSRDFDHSLDCVIITHFHLDHVGALPYFTEVCGYNGPIYMTYPTKALAPLMLEDFRKVLVDRRGEEEQFTSLHISQCMEKVIAVDLKQTVQVDDDLQIRAYYAGHVLGAAMFYAKVGDSAMVYTGDYNMTPDRHLGAAQIDRLELDLLITESTYATTIRDSKYAREREFLKAVHECVAGGGKVLIPTFALGRAQELCILLDDYWERMNLKVPIYFSAGLTIQANLYYKILISWTSQKVKETYATRNAFDFKHVHNFDRSLINAPGPCVLFATPGMISGGFSLEVFKQWAPCEMNLITLPGYCVAGTVGHKLMSGKPTKINAFYKNMGAISCERESWVSSRNLIEVKENQQNDQTHNVDLPADDVLCQETEQVWQYMHQNNTFTKSINKGSLQKIQRKKSQVLLEGYVEGSCSSSEDELKRTKSLTDDDLDELKGCLDLGFGFSYDEIPELCNTLPALELCYSMSQKFLDEHQKSPERSSPAVAEAANSSPIANWKISSPGDHPEDVKARLKYWAQAVACTVRLCS